MKTRIKAIICSALSLFLGGIGIQKFYLGQNKRGILYVLFFWTGIPYLFCIIDLLRFIFMNNKQFDIKYNKEYIQNESYEKENKSFNDIIDAEYSAADDNYKNDINSDKFSSEDKDILSKALFYYKSIDEKIILIKDYEFSSYVKQLNDLFKEIIDHADNNIIIKELDKMINYNIPATLKLISSYIELSETVINNKNVYNVKLEIKESIISVIDSLKYVLMNIQENNIMDISSDIDVLKSSLKKSGYI